MQRMQTWFIASVVVLRQSLMIANQAGPKLRDLPVSDPQVLGLKARSTISSWIPTDTQAKHMAVPAKTAREWE